MDLPNVVYFTDLVPNGCIAVTLMFNTHDVAGQFFSPSARMIIMNSCSALLASYLMLFSCV